MSGRKFSKQAELDFMHNFRHDTEGDRWAKHEIETLRQQLAAEIMRLEIALRIKTEEHKCCSEDLMKLRESEQSGWKEAAIAWEVCGSIHEAFAKKKDALYSTRHSDFKRHAEDARRMLSTESKAKVE